MLRDDQKSAVDAVSNRGWSVGQIAKHLGLTKSYVQEYLHEGLHGLKLPCKEESNGKNSQTTEVPVL